MAVFCAGNRAKASEQVAREHCSLLPEGNLLDAHALKEAPHGQPAFNQGIVIDREGCALSQWFTLLEGICKTDILTSAAAIPDLFRRAAGRATSLKGRV